MSVKNIDNVRPTSALGEVVPWRQALIGRTADLMASRNAALEALREGEVGPAQDWLRQGVAHPGEAIPSGACPSPCWTAPSSWRAWYRTRESRAAGPVLASR